MKSAKDNKTNDVCLAKEQLFRSIDDFVNNCAKNSKIKNSHEGIRKRVPLDCLIQNMSLLSNNILVLYSQISHFSLKSIAILDPLPSSSTYGSDSISLYYSNARGQSYNKLLQQVILVYDLSQTTTTGTIPLGTRLQNEKMNLMKINEARRNKRTHTPIQTFNTPQITNPKINPKFPYKQHKKVILSIDQYPKYKNAKNQTRNGHIDKITTRVTDNKEPSTTITNSGISFNQKNNLKERGKLPKTTSSTQKEEKLKKLKEKLI